MKLPEFIKKSNVIIINCDDDDGDEEIYEGEVVVWANVIILAEYREYHSFGSHTDYSREFIIEDYGKTWTAYEVV